MERGALPEPISERTCLLYDPQDGRIIHTHRSVVMPGGRLLTDEEVKADAVEFAQQVGHTVDGLATLLVADMDADNAAAYRVDVVNKALIRRRREPNFRPSMG